MPVNQNFLEIVMRGHDERNSIPIYNVFNYVSDTEDPSVSKVDVNTSFGTLVVDPVLAALSGWYELDDVAIRWLSDADDPYTYFGYAENGGISTATDDSPNYVCVTIQLTTGKRGRDKRGSKHFGTVAESHTLGNKLDIATGGTLTLWQNVAAACRTTLTPAGSDYLPVVVSRKPPSQLTGNPTTVVATRITGAILNVNLGTMRHRKIKVPQYDTSV